MDRSIYYLRGRFSDSLKGLSSTWLNITYVLFELAYYKADHFYSIRIALLIAQQGLKLKEYPLHNFIVEKLFSNFSCMFLNPNKFF